MSIIRKNLFNLIVLFLAVNLFVITAAADPVVDVSFDPLEPEPLSIVTFTVDITSGDTIDKVYIRIGECNHGICFVVENESMLLDGDNYSIDFTLKHSDATYFSYSLEIKSAGSWYKTEETNVTLKINTSNGEDKDNGNTGNADKEDDAGLPGFEILIFIAALFIALIFFRRKRL